MSRYWGRLLGVIFSVTILWVALQGTAVAVPVSDQTADTRVNETNQTAVQIDTLGTQDFQDTTANDIELTMELALVPSQKGTVEARLEYQIPDDVTRLEATVPDDGSITSLRGFTGLQDDTLEWDGTTEHPDIVFQFAANRSADHTGPIAGPGDYLYVDVGSWAIVPRPSVSHGWGWVGDDAVGFDRTVTAANGVTSDVLAYLGDFTQYTNSAHGQQFRLIVPEPATMAEDRSNLFDALSDASNQLRVGSRDESVFMIAAPTGQIDWGVRGLATGPSDLWVRDAETLDDPVNVWIHEYVHTRQSYADSPDFQWFREGSARYYGALFGLERQDISFEAFRETLSVGRNSQYSSSVLADPATWQDNADYFVGALVAAELDRQLRETTDREQSLEEIFRRMNAKNDVVEASTFQSYLEDAGGQTVRESGETYTETTTRPSMWSESEHNSAFDALPARITYRMADGADTIRVTGEYRNRSLAEADIQTFVTGETIRFDAIAENFGGVSGAFEAVLRVNDEAIASTTGHLDAGEQTQLSFDYTFDEPGIYTVTVGAARLDVRVREPATGTVRSLTVNRTLLPEPGSVTANVTVDNTASYPGSITVPLTRNDEPVAAQTVSLAGRSSLTLQFEQDLSEPGTYVFGLGNISNQTKTVHVLEALDSDGTDDNTTDGTDGTTDGADDDGAEDDDTTGDDAETANETGTEADDESPGFGVIVAIVAGVLAIAGSLLLDRDD